MVTFALRTMCLIHRLTNQQLSAEGTSASSRNRTSKTEDSRDNRAQETNNILLIE